MLNRPVACISGTTGMVGGRAARRVRVHRDLHRLVERAGQPGPERAEDRDREAVQQVALPPDDALRLARGAARVHEQLVGARSRSGGRGGVRGEELVEVRLPATAGPSPRRRPAPAAQRAARARGVRDVGGERSAEHDRRRVGVGEQLGELLAGVAVVRVDRDRADLERGEDGLQVRGAVVEVAGDRVARPDPGRVQRGGQPGGAVVELGVGVSRPGSEMATASGRVRDGLPDRAEGDVHRQTSSFPAPSSPTRRAAVRCSTSGRTSSPCHQVEKQVEIDDTVQWRDPSCRIAGRDRRQLSYRECDGHDAECLHPRDLRRDRHA